MGLLVAQMRLAQINNYRSDLEYQIGLISTTKLDLSTQINEMIGLGSDLESDSPVAKDLEKRKARLQQAEKALDAKLQRFQQQLEMINAEEQSVKQQRSEAIQRMYS